jgi:cystathionine beta-lyase/cystathionine gamma-synthase
VDTSQLDLIEPAFTKNTKYLFIETPTNPMLRITDLASASAIAHRSGVRVIVDNTFASPYIQQPLALGADIVMHSTTKFLNGHSDSVGGIVVLKHPDDVEWMKFVQNAAGAILGPMDSWLVLRGTKTLTIRMERTNANALALARHLANNRKVKAVIYPGLSDHPHHALAAKQMRGFGGLITFDVGSLDAARAVLPRFKLMSLAESLGGVETLISHPAVMTHASVPPDRRGAIGITDGMIRISVGIEDVEDLKEDADQALG